MRLTRVAAAQEAKCARNVRSFRSVAQPNAHAASPAATLGSCRVSASRFPAIERPAQDCTVGTNQKSRLSISRYWAQNAVNEDANQNGKQKSVLSHQHIPRNLVLSIVGSSKQKTHLATQDFSYIFRECPWCRLKLVVEYVLD